MKILITGSGKMGTDIFYYLLQYPLDMVWLCLDEREKQLAETGFQKRLSRQLRTGIISDEEYNSTLNRTIITSDISCAADRDLVIEAIWENMEAKQKLFLKLDETLPPDAIMTTNTSSIPLVKLIPSEQRENHFAGLHFFFPIKLHNIAEINTLLFPGSPSNNSIKNFLNTVDRKYILLNEGHHFLLNRLLLPLQNEAFSVFREGQASPEEIDFFVKMKLFPSGIFEFFDHVGIDIMLESVRNYSENFTDGNDYSDLISCFQKMVIAGKLGVKSGQGFYQYPRMQSNPEVKDKNSFSDQLEKAFFGTIQKVFNNNITNRSGLEFAINEYLGVDIMAMAKSTGYVF
jgi:3-hydroxybutyryl-CoA dehydrogenase